MTPEREQQCVDWLIAGAAVLVVAIGLGYDIMVVLGRILNLF